jgi:hypothetical protein
VKAVARPGRDASERELDAYVVELCRRHSWLTYHVVRPERGPAGFPDRTLSKGDVFGIVELKRSTGARGGMHDNHVAPSAAQAAWLEAGARARWLLSALWRPNDAERIELFLAGESVEPPGLWIPDSIAQVNR